MSQVVNTDADRTMPVAGPRHINKMKNFLRNVRTQSNLVTHLGRKCGALFLQMMGVGVVSISHHGGWDRAAKTMELCYATMPERDTMAVACGFANAGLYHIPRSDINPLQLQHAGLQKMFSEDDPWLEVEGLQEEARLVRTSLWPYVNFVCTPLLVCGAIRYA